VQGLCSLRKKTNGLLVNRERGKKKKKRKGEKPSAVIPPHQERQKRRIFISTAGERESRKTLNLEKNHIAIALGRNKEKKKGDTHLAESAGKEGKKIC